MTLYGKNHDFFILLKRGSASNVMQMHPDILTSALMQMQTKSLILFQLLGSKLQPLTQDIEM
jgi:hypothetical protein